MRSSVHEHVVLERRDLRDERTLRSEAVHGGLRMSRSNGMCSVEAHGGRARLRAGELFGGWLRLPGRISLRGERDRGCARLQ